MLIKVESKGLINPTREIRQGDPLSPYLSLICAEDLSSMLRVDFFGGIHGEKICRGAPTVSHLFFIDDSIMFSRATFNESNHIK